MLEELPQAKRIWKGNFRQNGKWHKLDNRILGKINKQLNPEKEEHLENEPIFLSKEFKIRQNRLRDDSFIRTIKFIRDGDLKNATKKTEKTKRQEKYKRHEI